MECERLETGMFVGLGETNFWVKLMVASRVTDTPFVLAFLENFKKGASYWRHGKTPLHKHMNYNTQCWDVTTIQYLLWGTH